MTAFALPAALRIESFALELQSNTRAFASPYGGSQQVTDMLNDRWAISLALAWEYSSNAAAFEAFFNKLRGGVHAVAIWHLARPAPQGTMRGTPTLAAAAAAGASQLSVQSVNGATLKAGDMLGVDGLLLQVADDVAFPVGGVQTVNLVNRLRRALTSGAAVAWDKPTAAFRLAGTASFDHGRALVSGQPLDFVEAIG